MKTLKLILAWLDWSTYCKSKSGEGWKTDYEFPKSLCKFIFRTAFSILALPFTWVTHLWNIIFVKRKVFFRESFKDYKANLLNTVVITCFTIFSGIIAWNITDGTDGEGIEIGWDLFHMNDPIILNYFKILIAGIVFAAIIAICLAIAIGIGYLIYLFVKLIKDLFIGSRYSSEGNYVKSSDRAIPRVFHAIKNKYCPTIDWSSIRNKK